MAHNGHLGLSKHIEKRDGIATFKEVRLSSHMNRLSLRMYTEGSKSVTTHICH
jgi:hypothetical protein